MSTRKVILGAVCALTVGLGLTPASSPAQADSLADSAVKELRGRWQDGDGRIIRFRVDEMYNTVFEDEVQSNIIVRGAYRRDDGGAGIVLIYPRGAGKEPQLCRYNVNMVPATPDTRFMFVLVESRPQPQANAPFRCIQGSLRRLPD